MKKKKFQLFKIGLCCYFFLVLLFSYVWQRSHLPSTFLNFSWPTSFTPPPHIHTHTHALPTPIKETLFPRLPTPLNSLPSLAYSTINPLSQSMLSVITSLCTCILSTIFFSYLHLEALNIISYFEDNKFVFIPTSFKNKIIFSFFHRFLKDFPLVFHFQFFSFPSTVNWYCSILVWY